jgi:hypothetical protein
LCNTTITLNEKLLSILGPKKITPQWVIPITCDKHPETKVEYYCSKHEIFICLKCAFDDHSSHKEKSVKPVENINSIAGYLDQVSTII